MSSCSAASVSRWRASGRSRTSRPISGCIPRRCARRSAARSRFRQAAGVADEPGARRDPPVARRELRAAPRERDLEVRFGVFREGARRGPNEVSRYIDAHRGRFGVEPICKTLGVSASAYYHRATGARSTRAVEDERLLERIREVHAANYYAYG